MPVLVRANKAHERDPEIAFTTHLSFLVFLLIMSFSILLAAAQWALFHYLPLPMAIGNLAHCNLPLPLLHPSPHPCLTTADPTVQPVTPMQPSTNHHLC